MLDIIIWLVFTLLIAPCVFCRDIRACCCTKKDEDGHPIDPDHAKKLADIGTDLESGRAAGSNGNNKCMWIVIKVCLALLFGYLAAMVILAIYVVALESSLVYSPESSTACVAGCTTASCCDYNTNLVTYEDVDFESSGATLNGWYMVSNTSDTSIPKPYVPLLYSHGSGKNVAVRYRVERYAFLLTLGVKMFSYDYPGYGKSTGTPTEVDIYAASKSAYNVLVNKANATADNVVLLGRSLGGGVTVNLATDSTIKSQGIILQSTFASLAGTGGDGMPVLGWWITAIMSQRYDSISKIGTYDKCVYESHSKADEWVQYDDGKGLYDAATNAKSSCSEFVSVESALHDDPLTDAEKTALTAWVNARRAAMV